jgi:hypothetical protein
MPFVTKGRKGKLLCHIVGTNIFFFLIKKKKRVLVEVSKSSGFACLWISQCLLFVFCSSSCGIWHSVIFYLFLVLLPVVLHLQEVVFCGFLIYFILVFL